MSLITITSVICITLFALLGLFLLGTQRGRTMVNRFLGLFFLFWALDFLDGLLMLNGFYLDYPNLALLTEPFIFLYGPLIYAYTRNTLDPERKLRKADLLHLIPFLAGILLIVLVYHIRPRETKIAILEQVISLQQPWEAYFVFLLIYLHFFWYLLISKRLISKATYRIKQFYSHNNLNWLRQLLNALIIVMIISVINSTLQFGGYRDFFEFSLLLIQLTTGIFIARLIFKALDQPSFLIQAQEQEKYAASRLGEEESLSVAELILKALDEEQLFLDPELTLDGLSKAVGTSSRKLSQVINERLGKNFFDLINGYRIEAAKQMLEERDDPKLTVLEVMYAVGFNSKSSFNTQFKAKTGLTPTEFLKMHS
ncbi:helix-turn-helix domain-containing protein [Poritiphilus flavus]|uniref:Helix-turn-helix domain-containing protein n=1 Tax=Poritiphilus flavus TaxID=2697053 RepID=A0A6L9E9Y6_9FLAO|nr:helix-turn-helix domain-containing protein [Poritiphilus flavus]NAS11530.1 helix-turn-helix domain-containing protein [Poritiphilus flavus]